VIRTLLRPAAGLAVAAALAAAAPATAGAAAEPLPDSTFVDQWTLANGLRVTTRHVPYATSVSVTIAHGVGSAADPAGREGLGLLLAELQFTGATAETPERGRDELDSQRPLGWRVKVLPRATVFSEACAPAQYPVVLHLAAQRMRGVTVSGTALERALGAVRADLRGLYRDHPDSAAYALPWAVAAPAGAAALDRLATGSGLTLPAREAERLMRQRFVPATAVLSLCGDLSGPDLRAFVEREFGGIPAGPAPAPAEPAIEPRARAVPLAGLSRPLGVVAVRTPALTDLDHPDFYIAALIMGSRVRSIWGPGQPPLSSSFKYAPFDDPDLVRFYPPTDPDRTDTTWVGDRLEEVLDPLARATLPPQAVETIKRNVYWLIGGPMLPTMARRARTDPALLHNLSTSMATRALWGSEEFWAGYRDRFGMTEQPAMEKWVDWVLARRNQVRVVLEPARR
jgi:hypothetical protein